MSKVWLHLHGTTNKCGIDESPETELWNEEQAKQCIKDFVDNEMEQLWDAGAMWEGSVIEPEERVNELMEVILEGEDTLFAKVADAKAELFTIVWDNVQRAGGFWFIYNEYNDGWFWQLELKDMP